MIADKFLKGNIFRNTIMPHPLCVFYDCNRCYVSVCTFGGILFLKLVPGSDFQFSGGQLTKKKNEKECINAWNRLNIQLQTLWFTNSAATIKKRYKIPPRNENTRNENTTTTNDINKHNIDNSKNYQTTTTTTKFLFNPILLFGTVSYDFIVAPDMTFLSFSLFLRQKVI